VPEADVGSETMPIGCNGQTLTSQEHELFAKPD